MYDPATCRKHSPRKRPTVVETNNGILCYFSFSFNPASVTSLNKLAKDIISSESKKVSVYLPTAVCARFSVTRENAVLLNMPLEKLKLRSTIIAEIPWIFCCERSQNITVHKYICTVIIRITAATFIKFLVLKVRGRRFLLVPAAFIRGS